MPNFFNLDIILQNGFPVSIVRNDIPLFAIPIKHDDCFFDVFKQNFEIEDDNIDLYNISIFTDTCMIIKSDGSSEIYSKNSETDKIYHPTKNEVNLEITQKDIEKSKLDIETTLMDKISQADSMCAEDSLSIDDIENKKGIISLFEKFKNFVKRPFLSKVLDYQHQLQIHLRMNPIQTTHISQKLEIHLQHN